MVVGMCRAPPSGGRMFLVCSFLASKVSRCCTQPTLQPMKIKPRRIWKDRLPLYSWLVSSRLDPSKKKSTQLCFLLCMAVDMKPAIMFSFDGLASNCSKFCIFFGNRWGGSEQRQGRRELEGLHRCKSGL